MSHVIDFANVPVIDNHCHAVDASQQVDVTTWRQFFTESPDPYMRTRDVADTAFYRRLIRAMALFYGVTTEEEVLRARERHGAGDLVGALFHDASIGGVVIDTGYPAPERAMSETAFRAASGSDYVALLRLEVVFQELIAKHDSYENLVGAVHELLSDVRGAGFAGFKSIVAYRTGLAIERWSLGEAQASFDRARNEIASDGAVRLGHKPLLDTLLHSAFKAAAAQELPVQFHVGYGDPDVDLRKASPLELRTILEEPEYRSMPIVLLHGSWPYFREGAYLASVYGNAYLDLSYGIPFLSMGEMTSMTRAALGAAPFSKLMYSSDGVGVPELHWMGAHAGRRAIGTVLGEFVADGDLGPDEAGRVGEQILRDNALQLYGFNSGATR
ncbi:MAG TPA: amidohydrolase family protein [Candidatus Paceibacterota bacterium]|nr:amidohydrolase family protein [Candidatus Paceibacterota bacterium]